MKKTILQAVLFLAAAALGAAEWKNVPYYDAEFPRSGNAEYLQERCVLDLKTPDGVKNFPTIVWFHGGGLTGGSKHGLGAIEGDGIAVAGVNYRLSGDRARCPDYLNDAAAAAAWVLKHIAEYGGDPKRVYVVGISAGGYLSAMIGLDPTYLKQFGTTPRALAGVIAISGQMTTHFQILNERRRNDPATPSVVLDEFAPISHASAAAPPMTLIVGDPELDWPARVEENQWLAAILRRNFQHRNVRCFLLPGFDHNSVLGPSLLLISRLLRTGDVSR